jgi:hypothetical protein
MSLRHGVDWMVEGEAHHHADPVRVGDLQVWDVVNETKMDHPFHLHGFFSAPGGVLAHARIIVLEAGISADTNAGADVRAVMGRAVGLGSRHVDDPGLRHLGLIIGSASARVYPSAALSASTMAVSRRSLR